MPISRIDPMLATNRSLGSGTWMAEPKLDGWRALVYVDGDLCVRTRSGRVVTDVLPELAPLVDVVPDGTVLDGELVAGQRRASDFYRLGPQMMSTKRRRTPLTLVAFDVLHLAGEPVTRLPWALGQSYSMRRPLMALEITSCWICSVPSKMSMVWGLRPPRPRARKPGAVRPPAPHRSARSRRVLVPN